MNYYSHKAEKKKKKGALRDPSTICNFHNLAKAPILTHFSVFWICEKKSKEISHKFLHKNFTRLAK